MPTWGPHGLRDSLGSWPRLQGLSWARGLGNSCPNTQEWGAWPVGRTSCPPACGSPLGPPSRGPKPPGAAAAAASSALSPVAAHGPTPGAAPEAGSGWRAHSRPCVPAGTQPQSAGGQPWPRRGAVCRPTCHRADRWLSGPAPYQAHHCSSCLQRLGVSCSGTETVDARRLVSYLSEISSRLRGSGLSSPSSRSRPRSSRLLSWEGGQAPDEELLSASSARHLGARPLNFCVDKGSWLLDGAWGNRDPIQCSSCPSLSVPSKLTAGCSAVIQPGPGDSLALAAP